MSYKPEKGKKDWIKTRTFYAVVTALVVAIVGVSAMIYNVSKIKNISPNTNEATRIYTVPTSEERTSDFQANLPATSIPDNRDNSLTTQKKSVVDDLNRPYTGKYMLPLDSEVIKSFSDGGIVYSKTMDDWRIHNGADISGNIGDNAVAIQDGEVAQVYTDTLWGDVIVINHGNGLDAKYCGVKSELQKGKEVKQGQVIGTVTQIPCEKEDGVHVHLETSINSEIVDPIQALNLMNDTTQAIE